MRRLYAGVMKERGNSNRRYVGCCEYIKHRGCQWRVLLCEHNTKAPPAIEHIGNQSKDRNKYDGNQNDRHRTLKEFAPHNAGGTPRRSSGKLFCSKGVGSLTEEGDDGDWQQRATITSLAQTTQRGI